MSDKPTTIEAFFLDEYNKLRKEVEELRAYKKQQEESPDFGIHDLHKTCTLVKYDVSSSYYWREYYLKAHDVSVSWFNSLIAMTNDDLFDALNRLDLGGWNNKAIERNEDTFQYTLMINESRSSWTGYTNGEPGDSITKIPEAPNVNEYVPMLFEQESRNMAISLLRENLIEVRDYLAKKIEADEDAQKE